MGRPVKIRINGSDHLVSWVDGKRVYDPPLDPGVAERSQKKFQQMTEEGAAPKANTDREFYEGMGTLEQQFKNDPEGLKQTVAAARAQGYEPHYTDFYMGNLADRTGDPKAFIQSSGGRGDIKRRCLEKGVTCEGSVSVTPAEIGYRPPPKKDVRLAEDLIAEEMVTRVLSNPDLGYQCKENPKKLAELREEVIETHGAPNVD